MLDNIFKLQPITCEELVDAVGKQKTIVEFHKHTLENLKEKLSDAMKEDGVEKVVGREYRGTWVVKDYGKVDWKRLARDLKIPNEIIEQYSVTVHTEYPLVLKRKDVK